jgi:hypothetical protein
MSFVERDRFDAPRLDGDDAVAVVTIRVIQDRRD